MKHTLRTHIKIIYNQPKDQNIEMENKLTTRKLRHARILDATANIWARSDHSTILIQPKESPPLLFISVVHEFNNNKDFSTMLPAYIKDVRKSGKTAACHCFIHKIAFQHANLAISHPFPICRPYNSIKKNNYHGQTNGSFQAPNTHFTMVKRRELMLSNINLTFLTHHMVCSNTINT